SGIFSLLYLIYTLILAFIISKSLDFINKCHNNNNIYSLNEDDCFVLNNKYNTEKLFYYITYKLYAKKILSKDTLRNKFYINDTSICSLSPIEENVYTVYLNKFAPKNFKSNMINEDIFRNYYNTIYSTLELHGFIKKDTLIRKNKLVFFIGLLSLITPAPFFIFYYSIYATLTFKIILVTLISLFLYILMLKNKAYNKLTYKGLNSKVFYKNTCSSIESSIEIETYIETLNEFLLDNSWMYFLGVHHIYDDDNDDYSGDNDFDGNDFGD
ncbi:hypothetical protein FDF63_11235, partial [Clostridium botulinum]|nr:hypothetical protein [Clostridium botulinum]